MGFYINEEITTKLHYKDITLISVTLNHYLKKYGHRMEPELKDRINSLSTRLYNEMYDNPKNKEPNGH